MRLKQFLLALFAISVSALVLQSAAASAASFSGFVGCSATGTAVPSHVCHVGDHPGVFFESETETEFEVCVTFPDATEGCLEEELAEAEVLTADEIESDLTGTYLVDWYVGVAKVATWSFVMEPAPLPPAPPAPPAAPAPIVTPPITVSPECTRDEQRVKSLKAHLRKALSHKQKARARASLNRAKAAAKKACA